MIKDRFDLMRIRHTRIIEDPFPEHTFYQSACENFSKLKKLLGMTLEEPEHISIHKAYQMGYDKAYKEIEESLG